MTGQTKLPWGGTIAVIGFAVLMISFWLIGPPAGTTAERASRTETEVPQVSPQNVGDVATYEQLTDALDDRLRMKPAAVSGVNSLVYNLTGLSPSSQVVAGSDQLFFAGDFTEPCRTNSDQWETWASESMQNLTAAAKAGGKTVLFVVVPDKSLAYPDQLGFGHAGLTRCQQHNKEMLERLAAAPDSPVRIMTPDQVMKGADRPYWQGDTHWTRDGGAALSETLAAALGNKTAVRDRLNQGAAFEHPGDLYRLMGLDRTETTYSWDPNPDSMPVFKDEEATATRPIRSFESPNPLPNTDPALFVYDSFVYATGIEAQLGSLFPSGYFLEWGAVDSVSNVGPTGVVVLESVQRLAIGRLAAFNEGGPMQPLLDYIADPATTPRDR